jgi:RNA polymerase sigma-70 factor, ECF subfamily
LLQALLELTDADRDVFMLSAVSGLSYSEISVAFGIPEGTVGSRIHRARLRLREALGTLEANTGRRGAPPSDRRQDGNDD